MHKQITPEQVKLALENGYVVTMIKGWVCLKLLDKVQTIWNDDDGTGWHTAKIGSHIIAKEDKKYKRHKTFEDAWKEFNN